MMRLGGWWRLWIVLSVAHVALVALFFANSWPAPERVAHGPWMEYRLSPSSAALLAKHAPSMESLEMDLIDADRIGDSARAHQLARQIIVARQNPSSLAPVTYRARNGHSFEFPPGTTDKETAEFAADYDRVLHAEVAEAVVKAKRELLAAAFIPPLFLLLFGLSVSWVRRGFTRG